MAVETVEMPDFSDPPGYEDEVTEEELLAGTDLVRPDQTAYDQCCLLVWGIPVVGSERIEKLKNVCGKLFALTHPFVSTHFPVDNEGKTKGYCFVEYADPSSASEACKVLDGHHLDKNHTFSAYLLSIMRELVQPPAQWVEPKLNEYVDAGDLWWWLQNQKCMDQFAVQDEGRDGLKLQVYWNAKGQEPYVVNDNASRAGWSEFIFKWSPQGTYLATFHAKGIALWGGEEFRKVLRIEHPGVSYLEFSPRESYIITYAQDDYGRFDNTLRVFDTFTGELKKTFQPTGSSGSGRIYDWPFLKWSHDEKYFAFCRVKGNCINIYNTETFSFETQIELPGLITFEWNPKKNTIAYYCEERFDQNAPAEIGIIEYPSKLKIRAQRIFSVSAANLYWQKEGKYLAANTERYSSRKIKDNEVKLTGPSSHIEVFDCTGKEVSVQTFQLSESFVHFGWEPKGDKFAVLIGSGNKVTPVVYKIDSSRSQPIVFGKLDPGVQLSVVKWAPQGGFLVVYAENSTTGQVLFIDANGTEATRIRLIEHASMNYGEWDPTGRYFVTASAGHGRFETGYRMFTFQGREFFKKSMEGLTRFKWRPRPSIVISEEKCKEINKNMKALSKKFEEEDRREQDKASKEIIEQRRKFMDEFNKIRRAAEERFAADRAERLKLRDGLDTDSGYGDDDYVEETIEIPLSTIIKPLKEDNTTND